MVFSDCCVKSLVKKETLLTLLTLSCMKANKHSFLPILRHLAIYLKIENAHTEIHSDNISNSQHCFSIDTFMLQYKSLPMEVVDHKKKIFFAIFGGKISQIFGDLLSRIPPNFR